VLLLDRTASTESTPVLEFKEEVKASIYDYPRYYDLLFGSDWKAEFDFFEACFRKHCPRKVSRIFEPACGTGRLLIKLANAGYSVGGNDLNPKAIGYCNDRFARFHHDRTAFVGDMSDFKLKHKVDATFNTINSFRHLPTESAAVAHLQCMARILRKGGIYILGIHLEPTEGARIEDEGWTARKGHLMINSYMWSKGVDKRRRMEMLGMILDVYTPTRHMQIEDHMEYRTYTHAQFKSLVRKVPDLKIAEVYDFAYDINQTVRIKRSTEDVVFILQKQ
jgi:SAM-dependent methyltransferase